MQISAYIRIRSKAWHHTDYNERTNILYMITYHGTHTASANNIVGPPSNIDVTRGGGELGRGFYLGENISLAKAIAVGKHGQANAAVIRFDIDDTDYVQLNVRNIHRRRLVYQLWQSLIKASTEYFHLFNVDVVCGPFATIDFSYQYKFESTRAQATLNNSMKQII